MNKIAALVVMIIAASILTWVAVYTTRAQAVGTAQMATANADGIPNEGISLSCGLEPAQTKCKAVARMPLDAKVGKWTISEMTFSPIAGGVPKRLSKHGDSSFEVVAHGGIVLPDSATVSDIR
jgi:hypothetical protein